MKRFCGIILAALAWSSPAASAQSTQYEVYAIEYGKFIGFPTRNLVAGADSGRRSDLSFTIWLLKAPGRTVLVDAGFYRQQFLDSWKPAEFRRPSEVLAAIGVPAGSVTDIIISHVHWDHADGADLFPNARIWIQREEYEHYVGPNGEARANQIAPVNAAMLAQLMAAGRVRLVEGDDQEIIPGIRVYTGGRHTFASQYAGVQSRSGTVIIASDNLYLYENLDRRVPIAATMDTGSNRAAQDRMRRLAGKPELIIPGHDPLVFTRFPAVGKGYVRVD